MYLTIKSVKISFNLVEKLLKSVHFDIFLLSLHNNSYNMTALAVYKWFTNDTTKSIF